MSLHFSRTLVTLFCKILCTTLFITTPIQLLANDTNASNGTPKKAVAKKPASKAKTSKAKASQCAITMIDGNVAYEDEAKFSQTWSLEQIANPDLEQNILMRYPSSVLNAHQKLARIIQLYDSYPIKDPVFRNRLIEKFPLFHDSVADTDGKAVIGNFDVWSEFAQNIILAAGGDKGAKKPFALIGSTGTGKTEGLHALSYARSYRSYHDDEYGELTYEFKNLDKITRLEQYVIAMKTTKYTPQLRRSPLVLLKKQDRDKLLSLIHI